MNRKNISIVFAGHKDHGKSTVLGRMFYDSGNISEDMMNRLKAQAKSDDNEGFEFAYVMDACREEQSRGITINLGHKKLITDEYSFTFMDAPGHKDFIDQMESGAESSEAVVLVIDVEEGIGDQTREHLQICRDKNIEEVIVVVNKMDLICYNRDEYQEFETKIIKMLFDVGYGKRHVIPCSALHGDNIVNRSEKMRWYDGMCLLELLEAHFTERPALGLNELKVQSKKVLCEMYEMYERPILLWAGGKDSTVMLNLAREALGDPLPFKVVFLNTGYQFKETYDYIDKYAIACRLDFVVASNYPAMANGVSPDNDKFECCNKLKTENLNNVIKDHKADAVCVGIRWDEHGIRGKENFFSERKDPPHTRVHPILNWSEKEVWEYLKGNEIPYNPLYDREEHGGLIIRSIGCYPCTHPVSKDVIEERASRDIDKEGNMEALRALGYM